MQIDEVIAEITQRCRNYGAQKIILFGSRAKGTATERSDIDIAVSGVASSDIFELELTWLRDWEKDHYDLGDNEIHLAFTTDDMEASHKKHEEMGCICFENPAMGIYFINDPDGYWLEIVPEKM